MGWMSLVKIFNNYDAPGLPKSDPVAIYVCRKCGESVRVEADTEPPKCDRCEDEMDFVSRIGDEPEEIDIEPGKP